MEQPKEGNCKQTYREVEATVQDFLKSDQNELQMDIPSSIRRQIRGFQEYHKQGLHYVALGSPPTLKLILSKSKIPITWEQLTRKTKDAFIKNSGLRIQPKIDHATKELLDPYISVYSWMELCFDAIRQLGGEVEFQNKHWSLEKECSEKLRSHPKYNEWKAFEPEPSKLNWKPSRTDFWNRHADGQWFLAIDLKAANFQVLRIFGLTDKETWEEFLMQFTDIPWYLKSKFLRLKALSGPDMFPNKQKIMWQNMSIQLLDGLMEAGIFAGPDFAAWNSDELVFSVDGRANAEMAREKCLQFAKENFGDWEKFLKFEIFLVRQIPGSPGMMKIEPGKLTCKCVDHTQLPLAIKQWEEHQNGDDINF
eukprot:TRINITY_DN11591_c0_g1_i1.p1 TRINITY_DN11591_c0_g1~~TRINITY_DN11591_c0_g1_i1.p1  ORF type:complete len:365 (-),score=63.24 TRINITY_DN11591_c0_g1_i1:4-1098(-)